MSLDREQQAYLAHVAVERGLSKNTVAAYRRDLGRYVTFLRRNGVTTLAEVRPALIAEFSTHLGSGADGGAPLAPASASRTVVAIRGWHRFAAAEGWTSADHASRVKPRAIPKRLPKAISIEAVVALIEAAGSDQAEGGGTALELRDRALLEMLYATGARISEVVGLDVDDLTLTDGEECAVLHGKGDKQRVVPIGHAASAALQAYVTRGRAELARRGRGAAAVFLNSRGSRLSRQSAWSILKSAAERARLTDVSPHTLRHSFATHLLSGGADVRVVQELLGHASVATTQVYTLVTRDSLRDAYLASHPRARGSVDR